MAKRLSREEKWNQAVVDIINEMFKIAGHAVTYDDVKERKDNWFNEWTMTEAQYQEWQKWGKKYLMKKLSLYAKQAEKEMNWVGLMWGLKFEKTDI
jgi:hypothetical protein